MSLPTWLDLIKENLGIVAAICQLPSGLTNWESQALRKTVKRETVFSLRSADLPALRQSRRLAADIPACSSVKHPYCLLISPFLPKTVQDCASSL